MLNDKKSCNVINLTIFIIYLVGIYIAILLKKAGLDQTNLFVNSFHVLFVRNEPVIFVLNFFFLIFLIFYFSREKFQFLPQNNLQHYSKINFKWIFVIAGFSVLFTWVGNYLIFHNFPLSNDEYLPRWQARVFLAGQIKVAIPEAWREFANPLTTIFVMHDPEQHTWTAGYLPMYAAIRTLLLAVGLESLTGPFLAGLSLIILAALSRRLWPQDDFPPFLAVILLVSSSQFVITSMTSYAMPAHLCFNLAWLYCYSRRHDKACLLIAPWIGFFALGLHNPFVHALFVTPFLVSILREKNWKITSYFAAVYLLGCLTWFSWMLFTRPTMAQGTDLQIFQIPGAYQLLIQPMNLALLCSWQSLALIFLAVLALLNWRSLSPFLRNLAWGCLLTFVFYFFFSYDQVLGWGYRFFYGVLGNLVLLAVAGWHYLKETVGLRKAMGFVVLCTALALFVQLPIRCFQVERFVRPFARAADYLESLQQSVVVINITEVWFSQLLVRNDPFLRNNPKIMFAQLLDEEKTAKLKSTSSVRFIQPEELTRFGLHSMKSR